MLILWMAYTAAFTAIVAGGALALDRVAAIWDVPRRFIWTAALGLALAAPIVAPLLPAPPARTTDSQWMELTLPPDRTARSPAAQSYLPLTLASRASPAWKNPREWERPARALWALASLVLLGVFARSAWAIHRRRSAWVPAEVDGCRVLVADDSGPAVIGAIRPDIVVPVWALGLDADQRALMLRHEAEHIAAHDPALLMLAAITVALLPWNAALWFIVERLRLAVEIDCDARVLRAVDRPREYGMLLIAVGARHSRPLSLAASLAERRPLLERRILAMTTLRPSRPLVASLPFAALAIAAVVAAAQTPRPASPVKTSTDTSQQAQEKRITASWENAPIADVLKAFARFSGKTILTSRRVQGTVTADVTNTPWEVALRQVMRAAGYDVAMHADGTLTIDAFDAMRPRRTTAAPAMGAIRAAIRTAPASSPPVARSLTFTADTMVVTSDSLGHFKVVDASFSAEPTAASTPRLTARPTLRPVPGPRISRDTLTAWIAIQYPQIMRGDTSLNFVSFVVDDSAHYVASYAGYRPQPASTPEAGGSMGARAGGGRASTITETRFADAISTRTVASSGYLGGINVDASLIEWIEVQSSAPGVITPNGIRVVIVGLKKQ